MSDPHEAEVLRRLLKPLSEEEARMLKLITHRDIRDAFAAVPLEQPRANMEPAWVRYR